MVLTEGSSLPSIDVDLKTIEDYQTQVDILVFADILELSNPKDLNGAVLVPHLIKNQSLFNQFFCCLSKCKDEVVARNLMVLIKTILTTYIQNVGAFPAPLALVPFMNKYFLRSVFQILYPCQLPRSKSECQLYGCFGRIICDLYGKDSCETNYWKELIEAPSANQPFPSPPVIPGPP